MRVDFYVLNGEQRRELFACKLCEKAIGQDQHVYIHTDSPPMADALDSLLWTFRDGSFIPHRIFGDKPPSALQEPVLIGFGDPPDELTGYPVLINLSSKVPAFYSKFERVAEIVNQDETVKNEGRQRFAFYREQGCNLHHHTI